MGVSSLPKTVTRQRRGCDLNPGPSAPESSTLTTWLLSHPMLTIQLDIHREAENKLILFCVNLFSCLTETGEFSTYIMTV